MLTSIAPFQTSITTVISDTVNLSQEARGFYLTVANAVTFVMPSDTEGVDGVTVTGDFAAGYHPWNIIRIMDTGTDAVASEILLGV